MGFRIRRLYRGGSLYLKKDICISIKKNYVMKRSITAFLLVFQFFLQASALSLSESQQNYSGRCIAAILDCQYDSALSLTDSVIAVDSADPLAPLLQLAALGTRDVDFDTMFDTASFFRTYRLAENRIATHEKTQGTSSYSKMLLGFCKGFNSAMYLRDKSYFAAMRNGFKALSLLDESRQLDTANVDPQFLLGLYDYAKGELRRRLWWVLFWYPGSKKEGTAKLWSCVNNGHITAGAALFALADIYVRENKPAECALVVERLASNFPKSRFTLWAKAKYFELRRLYYEAGLSYELLASSYAAEPAGRYNALLTRNLQAHMLLRSGQNKDAADSCRAILREHSDERSRPILNDTRKLLRNINDSESQ